jgi:hypothetical protein
MSRQIQHTQSHDPTGWGLGVAPMGQSVVSQNKDMALIQNSKPFLGNPTQEFTRFSDDRYPREMNTYENAFRGRNRYIEQILITYYAEADRFWTRNLLPWTEKTDGLTFEWDTLEFNDHILTPEPVLMVPRLLTTRWSANKASMLRQGIGLQLEWDFANTERGRSTYRMHLLQIVNAVNVTMSMNAAIALRNPKNAQAISPDKRDERNLRNKQEVTDYLNRKYSEFGGVHSYPEWLSKRVDTAQQVFTDRSMPRADFMVVPQRCIRFAQQSRALAGGVRQGPRGIEITSATAMAGVTTFESTAFPQGFGLPPIDVLRNNAQVNSYFTFSRQTVNNPDERYRIHHNDVWIYNEQEDAYALISYADAIHYAGLFYTNVTKGYDDDGGDDDDYAGDEDDDKGGRKTYDKGDRKLFGLTHIGRRFFGGDRNFYDYMSRCGIADQWIKHMITKEEKDEGSNTTGSFYDKFVNPANAKTNKKIGYRKLPADAYTPVASGGGGGGGTAKGSGKGSSASLSSSATSSVTAAKERAINILDSVAKVPTGAYTPTEIDRVLPALLLLTPLSGSLPTADGATPYKLKDVVAVLEKVGRPRPSVSTPEQKFDALIALLKLGNGTSALVAPGVLVAITGGASPSERTLNFSGQAPGKADVRHQDVLYKYGGSGFAESVIGTLHALLNLGAAPPLSRAYLKGMLANLSSAVDISEMSLSDITALHLARRGLQELIKMMSPAPAKGSPAVESKEDVSVVLTTSERSALRTAWFRVSLDAASDVWQALASEAVSSGIGASSVADVITELKGDISGRAAASERERKGAEFDDDALDEFLSGGITIGQPTGKYAHLRSDLGALMVQCQRSKLDRETIRALFLVLDQAILVNVAKTKNITDRMRRELEDLMITSLYDGATGSLDAVSDSSFIHQISEHKSEILHEEGDFTVRTATSIFEVACAAYDNAYTSAYDPPKTGPIVNSDALAKRIADEAKEFGGARPAPYVAGEDKAKRHELLQKYYRESLKHVPLTWHFVEWCLEHHFRPLFNLLCFRQGNYETGTIILMKGNGDAGLTCFAKQNFMLSMNTLQEFITGHYSIWSKSIVTNPMVIQLFEDAVIFAYRGGNSIEFYNPLDTTQVTMYKDDNHQCADIHVCALPANENLISEPFMDMTGRMHQSLAGYHTNKDMANASGKRSKPSVKYLYSSAPIYKEVWGWENDDPMNMPLNRNNVDYTSDVRQSTTAGRERTRIWGGGDSKAVGSGNEDSLNRWITGTGAFGNNVYDGVGKTRNMGYDYVREVA